MIEAMSLLVGVVVALGGFIAWRAEHLRREEVLDWGLKCIDALQTLHLYCESANKNAVADTVTPELARQISVMAEQGRMYFKNASPEAYGSEKEPAYRGYRPVILDQLVFSFFVAKGWDELSAQDKPAGAKVVAKCKERFVSLLQREVGRKRTADRYNKEAGIGYRLNALIALAKSGDGPNLPAEEKGLWARIRRTLRF